MRIDLTRVGRRFAIWLRVCLQREAHREPALGSWTITAGICGSSLPSRASSCTASRARDLPRSGTGRWGRV
jgi:hypothetical protein